MRVRNVIDLCVPVDAGTVVYPGDPKPRFEQHSTIEADGFNLLEIHLGSQSGTHVDAPYHFEPDGLRIDEVPLDRFAGPGVVVDATDLGPRGEITWDHVAPVADRLEAGVVVLLRTGWSRHYGTPGEDHPGVGFPCHHLISGLDGIIGENFRLDDLPTGEFLVVCTPLRLTGADGGPVRAVAIELAP